MAACDTVVFLDYPVGVCLEGIRERMGKPRSDMPWIETEEDAEFIRFVTDYHAHQRPIVMELLARYREKRIVVLKSRAQADAFLSGEGL